MNSTDRRIYEDLKDIYIITPNGSPEEVIARGNILEFYNRIDGGNSGLRSKDVKTNKEGGEIKDESR